MEHVTQNESLCSREGILPSFNTGFSNANIIRHLKICYNIYEDTIVLGEVPHI